MKITPITPASPSNGLTYSKEERRKRAEELRKIRPMIDNTKHGEFERMMKEKAGK